jgi:Tol biopolymer transport system component
VRLGRPSSVGEFALASNGALAFHPGVEPFGESLAIVGSGDPVYIYDPASETHEEPAFSPDGRRVALMLGFPTRNVWVYDRDLKLLDRFTVDGSGRSPVWTRDGTHLTFTSERDGGPTQLYRRRADRSAEAERLLVSDFPAFPGSWLPGDRTLAFQAQRESWDIGFLTVQDSSVEWVLASEFNEIQPQVSPDGRWLAYASDRSGTSL